MKGLGVGILKSRSNCLDDYFSDHPCLHYATCCWMALAVQACGTGRTVRHGGTAHLRGEKTKVLQVSSTTYRRRQEWLQSCYEMTLTELLYLTWPRSPQNPVSVEYAGWIHICRVHVVCVSDIQWENTTMQVSDPVLDAILRLYSGL
nr:uncharacterized protein LOC109774483 isoform X2 [Aegilops tauschii subsp. strangulata]